MQQEQRETSKQRANHCIKEILGAIGGIILVVGILIFICYLMYVFDIEPLKRSALGTPIFFDPDGLSLYERICTIFGWVS